MALKGRFRIIARANRYFRVSELAGLQNRGFFSAPLPLLALLYDFVHISPKISLGGP